MMDLVRLQTTAGVVLWARLTGPWNDRQLQRLREGLAEIDLSAGHNVILDLSGLDHVDYRAVPHLIDIGQWVESRGGRLWVVGLSDYLRRIIQFGGALEGREFLERHAAVAGVAGSVSPAGGGDRSAARRLADWMDSMGAAAVAARTPRRSAASAPRSFQRVRRLALRHVSLAACESWSDFCSN